MEIYLKTDSLESYQQFLAIKALPRYRIRGHVASIPDEYARTLGLAPRERKGRSRLKLADHLYDYQRAIVELALRKKRFSVFARPGLGKTPIYLEAIRHVLAMLPKNRCALITSPLMPVEQIIGEAERFHGKKLPIDYITASNLQGWLDDGNGRVGITNYESIREGLRPGRLGMLVNDESSIPLKSHYGAWGTRLQELARGLEWIICSTGTPAPNDRMEFAGHAVMMGRFPTINSFLARFFINRGQTGARWELKHHAIRPFYRALSDWCIFLNNPATYGWKDNSQGFPPIYTHIHDVELSDEQKGLVSQVGGDLYGTPGGIGSRAKVAALAKGWFKGKDVATGKPAFIRQLLASWPEESTIVWCRYNPEQDMLARCLPGSVSINGRTTDEQRAKMIADFQAGRVKTLITKDSMLAFGLNFQVATRQIFSTIQDSYEKFWQCLMRSNRIGSTRPLNVHLPLTFLERPMAENVLAKAKRVQEDIEEQEAIFREVML